MIVNKTSTLSNTDNNCSEHKPMTNKKNKLENNLKKGNKFKEQTSPSPPSPPAPSTASSSSSMPNGTKGGNSKTNSKMLEAFWKLSEFNSSTRLEGINQLVRYFSSLDPRLNQEGYNYVLIRLIRGLASNRKCSRLGFSCALTELINSNETLKFEYILELARKHLNYSASSPEDGAKKKQSNDTLFTKEEIRHMQIGLAFVYLCWIQSNRFQKVKHFFGSLELFAEQNRRNSF